MIRIPKSGLLPAFLLAFGLLQGCASNVPRIEVPAHIVTVTQTKYVALPAALVAACALPLPADGIATNSDLLNAYLVDAANLQACAAQVDAIRKLQPQK